MGQTYASFTNFNAIGSGKLGGPTYWWSQSFKSWGDWSFSVPMAVAPMHVTVKNPPLRWSLSSKFFDHMLLLLAETALQRIKWQ